MLEPLQKKRFREAFRGVRTAVTDLEMKDLSQHSLGQKVQQLFSVFCRTRWATSLSAAIIILVSLLYPVVPNDPKQRRTETNKP